MEQKFDIATRELDELRDELQRKKEEEERALDTHRVSTASLHPPVQLLRAEFRFLVNSSFFVLKLFWQAVVGEADLRLAEMKKLEYEFDRDIVRGAINPVSCIFIQYGYCVMCLSVVRRDCRLSTKPVH